MIGGGEGSPHRAASFTWQPRVGNLVGYLGAVNARLPYGHRVGLGHDRHDRDVAADLVHELEVRWADPERVWGISVGQYVA